MERLFMVNKTEQVSDKVNVQYPPSLPFSIEKMWLRIEPDFEEKRITGEVQLKLFARQNIDNVELDIGNELKIKSIFFSTGADANTNYDIKELTHNILNNKLIIPLENTIKEDTRFYIIIKYTANGSDPGKGIHFVDTSPGFPAHIWTQSESIYARNWFPCLDHPQVKFPREVSVIVPEEYNVISNGELDMIKQNIETKNGISKKVFVWEEPNPNTAYLTSVVIGKYIETSKGQNYNGIPLRYYVPQGREEDAKRTFKNTANMMRIFEEYFYTKYPYNKYSQVVAKGLYIAKILGMEHTTCTTLDIDQVLAEKSTPEYKIDEDTIAHELAHQWFGDLVTCKDWQHIWLNEGFAAFCEALYIEKSKGEQQYQETIMGKVSYYLVMTKNPNTKTPIRAIVTKKYKDPDDLFDHNSYAKGGIILHMLRKYIGDEDFRKSLKIYLEKFKHGTAETDDLRQIMEEISGISLQQFFDQWIYREGHPIFKLQISDDNGKVKLSIIQQQIDDAFVFPLEINFVFRSSSNGSEQKSMIQVVQVLEKNFSRTFDIQIDTIDYISIDPEYKILKEYISVDVPQNFIRNQIQHGKTIFEKIEGANILKKHLLSSKISLDKKMIFSNDQPYSLIKEAARANYPSISVTNKNNEDYEYVKKSLQETTDPQKRTVMIDEIGNFQKKESYILLKGILEDDNADPYERYSAAIAIANTGHEQSISLLKRMSENPSYHNLVARGCIEGLKIIGIRSNEEVKEDIENFIVEKMRKTKESRLKRNAASALGYLARHKQNKTQIIKELEDLLFDESLYVRNTACVALAVIKENTNDVEIVDKLRQIAEQDSFSQVRDTANVCIKIIKGDSKIKEKATQTILDEETKLDSKFKSDKFDLLERIDILP
jgi:aminopeptidase N